MSTRPANPGSSNSSAAAAAARASRYGANGVGFASLRTSGTSFSPTQLGALRPTRPAQLSPAVAENIAGGMDPQDISEISHLSAAALLDRVRHSEDPEVVRRVLALVETVGVDEIAELWSKAEPDSLPGILWRLYLLRTWMRTHRDSIARLWRVGEPVATSASAIARMPIVHCGKNRARVVFISRFVITFVHAMIVIAVLPRYPNSARNGVSINTVRRQARPMLILSYAHGRPSRERRTR